MKFPAMLCLLFFVGATGTVSFVTQPSDVTLTREDTAELECVLDEPVTCAWRLEQTGLNSSGFLNSVPPPLIVAGSPLHPSVCTVRLTHPSMDYSGRFQCAPYVSSGEQILSAWANVHVESSDEFICPTESGTFPDDFDCHFYYVCINGSALHEKCPDPLVFNPSLLNCDYVEHVPSCQ